MVCTYVPLCSYWLIDLNSSSFIAYDQIYIKIVSPLRCSCIYKVVQI